MKRTSEAAFETAIEAVLLADGYTRVEAKGFDRERAIFPDEALAFIRATRGKVWEKLEALHGEGYAKPLDGPRDVGSGMVREERLSLSRLIDIINQRFGGELNEADQLFFDQIAEAASQNEALQKAAEVNPLDKFQLVFRQVLESLFIERMELNEELFNDYMGKPEMRELVSKWLGSQVYDRLSSIKSAGRHKH